MKDKATEKQLALIVTMSEQKQQPKEHAELITSLDTITVSQAGFLIEKLKQTKHLVDIATFNYNNRISKEGPKVYTKRGDADRIAESNKMFQHKLHVFHKGNIADKALVYLDLDQIGHEDWEAFKKFLAKAYPWDIEQEVLEYLKERKMDDGLYHGQVKNLKGGS